MFEKIGVTLTDSGEYEVTIIGYPSVNSPAHPSIGLHPLPAFRRSGIKRFLIPWIIFKKINQVKPDLVLINTPELLFVAMIQRMVYGRRIIYDVLENYYRNIRHTPVYPFIVRWILAPLVRLVEGFAFFFVHRFLLAEKSYEQELTFAKPHVILENKLPRVVANQYKRNEPRGYTKLIFTGTLAQTTGIFEAIHLSKELHKIDRAYSLTIIGYCALPEVLNKIKKEIAGSDFITLKGGDALVPHAQIMEEIQLADVGLILYPNNRSTENSIPTKLYEYLALRLPIIIHHNQPSHDLVKQYNAGIVLSEAQDFKLLAQNLKEKAITPTPPDSIFWENEGEKLIAGLKNP